MSISREEFARRQRAVRKIMEELDIDALVAFGSPQLMARGLLRWLVDWSTPVFEEFLVLPLRGPTVLFVHDASEAACAEMCCAVDEVRVIPALDYVADPCRSAAACVEAAGADRVATAGRGMSAAFLDSLERNLEGRTCLDLTPRIDELRMAQSPEEVRLSEAAVALNEAALRHYVTLVKPGVRETDAVARASAFALEQGAEELYWMAASGPVPRLALMAQARAERHVWQKGEFHTIILEHAAAGGYMGETTQLISLGKPRPEYVRAIAAVGEAQRAAAAAIRPGAAVGSVADAAERVLVELGFALPRSPGVPPSPIGHGQGADVWEPPCIVSGDSTPVRAGMRFNLHPAVRLPDGAVLTSCDCWIAEEDGARRLSTLPAEIIEV